MNQIEKIKEFVIKGNFKEAVAGTVQALNEKTDPQSIIDQALIPAMEEVGKRFECGEAFVPEMLMAARAMKAALETIKPYLTSGQSSAIGKIIIGTVKGDLHDIGKNLVASMLEGVGFEVINLGIDVDSNKFIQAINEHQPDILCMSALLTTTMTMMENVIKDLEVAGLRQKVKIMVGGAPVSNDFAMKIGADGYSDNAHAASELAKQLMSA